MSYKVTLPNKEIEVESPQNSTLLALILKAGIPWKNRCSMRGTCAKCKFKVVEGCENLNPLTETEERLRFQKFLDKDERLACKVIAKGDIKILPSNSFLESIDNQ
jgi:ferredoxin